MSQVAGAASWFRLGYIYCVLVKEPADIAAAEGGHLVHSRLLDVRDAALTLFAERGYRGTTMRDIAEALGIQAPSLYNYVRSKNELLRDIMFGMMSRAHADFRSAVGGTDDVAEQLRLATEAHARLPIRYRREVLITNKEILSLDEPDQALLSETRVEYERGFRTLIERGCASGRFSVASPRMASFAILEMSNGLATWYRQYGPLEENDIVPHYGEYALRIVRAIDV